MWKYAAANGVSGTPTFIINGAQLMDTPQTTADWLTLLKNTDTSQWVAPTGAVVSMTLTALGLVVALAF